MGENVENPEKLSILKIEKLNIADELSHLKFKFDVIIIEVSARSKVDQQIN